MLASAHFSRVSYSEARIYTDNAAAFTSKYELIKNAKSNIDLSYFIIDSDYSSSLLAEKLLDKIQIARDKKEKLQIRILVDYFMSEKQLPFLRLLDSVKYRDAVTGLEQSITVKRYGAPTQEWKNNMARLKINGPLFVSSLMAQSGSGLKEALKDADFGVSLDSLDFNTAPQANTLQWATEVVGKIQSLINDAKVTRKEVPLFIKGLVTFLHRTHHKLLLIDGKCYQMGGRNLSDEYHAPLEDALITGDAARGIEKRPYAFNDLDVASCLDPSTPYARSPLTKSFERLWADGRNTDLSTTYTAAEKDPTTLDVAAIGKKAKEAEHLLAVSAPSVEVKNSQRSTAAYVENKNITETYIQILQALEEGDEAVFVNAYFFVDPIWLSADTQALKRLYNALLSAAKKAKVSIYTNSIKTTDLNIVNAFSYAGYQKLLESGLKLYELADKQGPENKRSSLHMKGGYYTTKKGLKIIVGSYNLDPRSHARDTNNALILWIPQEQASATRTSFDAAINSLNWLEIVKGESLEGKSISIQEINRIANEKANADTRRNLTPAKVEI